MRQSLAFSVKMFRKLGLRWKSARAQLSAWWCETHRPNPRRTTQRPLALELLEDRMMLAADLEGDDLQNALFVNLQPNVVQTLSAEIGDGDHGGKDVDFYKVDIAQGQTLVADIDAQQLDGGGSLSNLNSYLRLFNSQGFEWTFNDDAEDPNTAVWSYDAALTLTGLATDTFYLGVSHFNNGSYDPTVAGSGTGDDPYAGMYGDVVGDYQLSLQILDDSSGGGGSSQGGGGMGDSCSPDTSSSDHPFVFAEPKVMVGEDVEGLFLVIRSASSTETELGYRFVDITATRGIPPITLDVDYYADGVSGSGTIELDPTYGLVQTIPIGFTTLADSEAEPTEEFRVEIFDPANPTTIYDTAIGFIVNTDEGDDVYQIGHNQLLVSTDLSEGSVKDNEGSSEGGDIQLVASSVASITGDIATLTHGGLLSIRNNGFFTFLPQKNFVGLETFQYEYVDDPGEIYDVYIFVTNAAPDARDDPAGDEYTTPYGQSLFVSSEEGLLNNDTDRDRVDTGRLKVYIDPFPGATSQIFGSQQGGQVTVYSTGAFSYRPPTDPSLFTNGAHCFLDTFVYRTTDGLFDHDAGGEPYISNEATVRINVTNIPPVAKPDEYSVFHDTAPLYVMMDQGVLANDSDEDRQLLRAVLVQDPSHGTLVLKDSGGFSYKPAPLYVGTDTFTYKPFDGVHYGVPEEVSIEVWAMPLAASDDSYEVLHDTKLIVRPGDDVLSNDAFEPGYATVSVPVNGGPSHGDLIFHPGGSFSYTPNAGYVGSDSFDYVLASTLDPQATPGSSGSSSAVGSINVTATVTINVTNKSPSATNDLYTVLGNHVLAVSRFDGLLDNDNDEDIDWMTVALVSGQGPQHGSLALNPDGSFRYTPDTGYLGTDSFTYQVSDGIATDTGQVSIKVEIDPDQVAPIAGNDSYVVLHDDKLIVFPWEGLLANDEDQNFDPLTAAITTGPAHGALTLNANGAFIYTPTAGYVGDDGFTYTVSDGVFAPVAATVDIEVTNIVPEAKADQYDLVHDSVLFVTVWGGILANDKDGDGDKLTRTLDAGPQHGNLQLNDNGSLRYEPDAGFSGVDTFTYRASDGVSASDPVTVTLTVTNEAPKATGETYRMLHNNPTRFTLSSAVGLGAPVESTDDPAVDSPLVVPSWTGILINDADPDGDVLTVQLETSPTHGTFVLDTANGSFRYVPDVGFVGEDKFSYKVND
ncbi:MAG: tandem-95 repeat protein, partial [Planctomycetes bacterium]|nr:tandem-95 repeat protein [Planctomycetota bacterium]